MRCGTFLFWIPYVIDTYSLWFDGIHRCPARGSEGTECRNL